MAIVGSDAAVPIMSRSLDLPELQGEPDDVVREKCLRAASLVRAQFVCRGKGGGCDSEEA